MDLLHREQAPSFVKLRNNVIPEATTGVPIVGILPMPASRDFEPARARRENGDAPGRRMEAGVKPESPRITHHAASGVIPPGIFFGHFYAVADNWLMCEAVRPERCF